MRKPKNREEWLTECIAKVRPMFEDQGRPIPEKVRASCSWPSQGGLAQKQKRIGEAWSSKCSGDGTFEVFISPVLMESAEVAAVLVHELVHCAVGLKCGHNGPFRKLALAVGLEGKMTATTAGEELAGRLERIVAKLGEYPHSKLKHSNAPKKQSTRMKKVECDNCGCIVRMTRKWLEEVGCPTCACGGAMKEEEGDD